jgi:four helix bundle protein
VTVESYEQLDVWKASLELADQCFDITRNFPPVERFSLGTQLQRASLSIPSNIAEGNCRPRQAYLNHLSIALGSLAEVQTCLILCGRRSLVAEASLDLAMSKSREVGRLLAGLVRALKRLG